MKYIAFFLVVLLLFASSKEITAHSSDVKEGIAVLMHAEPEDRPLANKPTILHFQIEDASHEFEVKNCNCIVTIYKDGQKLFEKPAHELTDKNSIYSALTTVTFNKEGKYKVSLEGKPKESGMFHPFTARFDLEVGKNLATSSSELKIPNFVTYLILTVIGIGTTGLVIRQILSKKN